MDRHDNILLAIDTRKCRSEGYSASLLDVVRLERRIISITNEISKISHNSNQFASSEERSIDMGKVWYLSKLKLSPKDFVPTPNTSIDHLSIQECSADWPALWP